MQHRQQQCPSNQHHPAPSQLPAATPRPLPCVRQWARLHLQDNQGEGPVHHIETPYGPCVGGPPVSSASMSSSTDEPQIQRDGLLCASVLLALYTCCLDQIDFNFCNVYSSYNLPECLFCVIELYFPKVGRIHYGKCRVQNFSRENRQKNETYLGMFL